MDVRSLPPTIQRLKKVQTMDFSDRRQPIHTLSIAVVVISYGTADRELKLKLKQLVATAAFFPRNLRRAQRLTLPPSHPFGGTIKKLPPW